MDHILKEDDKITLRDRKLHNIKINKNIPNNIKHIYKFADNYKVNRKKVKNEMSVPKKIADAKKNNIKNNSSINNDLNSNNENLPSEVVAKLLNVEGEELSSEIVLPIETNILDLNLLLNKLKKNEETQSYVFLIDDLEIKNNLADTIKKIKDFKSDSVIKIIYHPESLFSVKPLTRASATLEGHTDSILTTQFSPNGKYLASGGGDYTVRFWDTDTQTPSELCEGHNNWVLIVNFSPDSEKLATGSVDGILNIWNPENGKAICKNIKAHSKWITSISWKPLHLDEDCQTIATTSKDGFLKIWNIANSSCILNVHAHESSITKSIWSGNDYIYTASQDKLIKIWKESGDCVNILKGHAHWINTMSINTEHILKNGCFDFENKKIEFSNKREKYEYAVKRFNKFKLQINGEKIVSGSDDFTLILWDPLTQDKKQQIARMTGHQGLVNHVQFSPDTLYLASASFDKGVKIWNGHTGAFLFNFRGHVGAVYQISWSPDSRLLLSCSKDSTVKCWNVKVKRLMFELPGHADEVIKRN